MKKRCLDDLNKYKNIYLFGAGGTCKSCIESIEENNVKINGILDNDINKWGKKIKGYDIFSPNKINEMDKENTAIMISAVSNQYEIANELINKYKFNENSLYSYTNDFFEKAFKNCEIGYKEKLNKVIPLLEDENSKRYVEETVNNRITRNPLYLKGNSFINKQYEYANKVVLNEEDVIVDCGAYIGDTAELFMKKLNNKCKIICIEPFKESYKKLLDFADKKDNISCYNFAVSNYVDEKIISSSDSELFSGAKIKDKNEVDNNINNEIKVSTLDKILEDVEKVDYIKMDIEGEEVNALKGAKDIIKKFKPNMMISAYHVFDHIFEIPMLIKSINPEYKIYAGHQPGAPFEIEYYISR